VQDDPRSFAKGIGAIKNNFKFTGVELDERYANIAKQRIKASLKNDLDPELFEISND
jgi:DNA modification methylase